MHLRHPLARSPLSINAPTPQQQEAEAEAACGWWQTPLITAWLTKAVYLHLLLPATPAATRGGGGGCLGGGGRPLPGCAGRAGGGAAVGGPGERRSWLLARRLSQLPGRASCQCGALLCSRNRPLFAHATTLCNPTCRLRARTPTSSRSGSWASWMSCTLSGSAPPSCRQVLLPGWQLDEAGVESAPSGSAPPSCRQVLLLRLGLAERFGKVMVEAESRQSGPPPCRRAGLLGGLRRAVLCLQRESVAAFPYPPSWPTIAPLPMSFVAVQVAGGGAGEGGCSRRTRPLTLALAAAGSLALALPLAVTLPGPAPRRIVRPCGNHAGSCGLAVAVSGPRTGGGSWRPFAGAA